MDTISNIFLNHPSVLSRRSCWSGRRTWRRRSTGRPRFPRTCPGSTHTLASSPSAPGTMPMVSGPLMVSTGSPVCNGSLWRNHRYRVFLLDQDSAYTGAVSRALESSSSPDSEYPHYSPYTHSTSFLHHASSSRILFRHNSKGWTYNSLGMAAGLVPFGSMASFSLPTTS